ncbi:MAG: metabolism protein [Paenibacillaceae bacterium]|jgi:probable DNA metabolism protein|nr:metabolism protein [Paenibacillaceae bacterium]
MPYRTDLAYTYDGSFEGLLCCVFESYEKKELPFEIHSAAADQGFLFESRWIETDYTKAERVYRSIPVRISPEAQELVRLGFLTCAPHKELLLLRFLRLGFTHGRKVTDMLADDTVSALTKAVYQLTHESHKFTGFVRFSIYGQVMVAVIEPRNQVLPVMQEHFCDRFHNEVFLIHDKTHGMALVHRPGESGIISLEQLELPAMDAEEAEYRRLWQRFYDSIAIRERVSERRRMSHMPKRYWGQLPEMQRNENCAPPSSTQGNKSYPLPKQNHSYAAESQVRLSLSGEADKGQQQP